MPQIEGLPAPARLALVDRRRSAGSRLSGFSAVNCAALLCTDPDLEDICLSRLLAALTPAGSWYRHGPRGLRAGGGTHARRRSTAISPATWRCAWPRPHGQNPRKLAPALIGALPANRRRSRKWKSPAPASSIFSSRDGAYHARDRPDPASRAAIRHARDAARAGACCWNSSRPIRPGRCTSATAATPPTARPRAICCEAAGYRVAREYYINDAGRQMDILAVSTWLRYLRALRREGRVSGQRLPRRLRARDRGAPGRRRAAAHARARRRRRCSRGLPPMSRRAATRTVYIDALIVRVRAAARRGGVSQACSSSRSTACSADIREDLAEFGVQFDRWFSERSLSDSGAVERALAALRAPRARLSSRTARCGSGAPTSATRRIASWCATTASRPTSPRHRLYLQQARARLRAPDRTSWARTTTATSRALRAALIALGGSAECFEVRLMQFVTLYRGGEKMPMSTRSGEFVTPARAAPRKSATMRRGCSIVMRSNDQHLDFDLELAKARSNENPVYYIQYAHARVSSVMRQLAGARARARPDPRRGGACAPLDRAAGDAALIKRLCAYPEIVELAAAAARAARAGALLARPGERFSHLLQRAPVHRRGRGAARRAPEPGARDADRDPQRPRTAGRVRARHACRAAGMARAITSARRRTAGRLSGLAGAGHRAGCSGLGVAGRRCTSRTIAPKRRRRTARKPRQEASRPRRAGRRRRRRRGARRGAGEILRLLRHAAEIRGRRPGKGQGRAAGRAAGARNAPRHLRPAGGLLQEFRRCGSRAGATRRCRGSSRRCKRCRSTTTPGTASASVRSPSWTS